MKKILFSILLISSIASAQTWWLNIPGFVDENEIHHPAISIPTRDHDTCSDAISQYATMEYIYYIGCDVEPLKDASNLKLIKF